MRIWHQGMNATNRIEGLRGKSEELAALVASPGTQVDFFGLGAARGIADRLAGQAVRYLYLHRLQVDQIIRNARQAQAEGYDAFIIGVLQDPGLREVRSIVGIPAVGYGETAMHVAGMLGSRFAIVAFNPDLFPLVEHNIRIYGLEHKAGPILDLGLSYEDIGNALSEPARFLDRFSTVARQALAAGADVIIPGQALLCELLYFNGVSRIDEAPVLNVRALTIQFAEMLVRLRQTTGLDISRRGYFSQRPPADLLDIAHTLYVAGTDDPKGGT